MNESHGMSTPEWRLRRLLERLRFFPTLAMLPILALTTAPCQIKKTKAPRKENALSGSGRMVMRDSTVRNRSWVCVGKEYVGDDTYTSCEWHAYQYSLLMVLTWVCETYLCDYSIYCFYHNTWSMWSYPEYIQVSSKTPTRTLATEKIEGWL